MPDRSTFRGLRDGLGIEPAKVRQLPVLSPEQFDQVQARVEGIRAVRARRSLGGRCRTRREGGGSSWGFAGGGSHGTSVRSLAAYRDVYEATHSELLRDLFGNPFRPVVLSPSWRTSTLVTLAETIYDERAFDRLPILADALEEGGCGSVELLAHCRSPGRHARGCWAVDLVLGKG